MTANTLTAECLQALAELYQQGQVSDLYVQRSPADEISVITYSYHWANADNQLIKRWDNTPHFRDLLRALR